MKSIIALFGFIIGAAVVTLSVLIASSGQIYDFKRITIEEIDSVLEKSDVIICLAGGRGRIATAADLWLKARELHRKAGRSGPSLYLSGVGIHFNFQSLPEAGISPAVLRVLTEKDLILEGVSSNTDENAQIFKSFQRQMNWKSGVLVTSSYHIKRARFMFDRILGSVNNEEFQLWNFSSGVESFEESNWRKDLNGLWVTTTEYLKWVYYSNFFMASQEQLNGEQDPKKSF